MADTCPKCGRTEVESDKCPGCGVVIPVYQQYLAKLRQSPTAAVAIAPSDTGRPAIAAPPAATSQPPTSTRPLSFHGAGGTLFGIQIVNALLVLATLGVYYFWAKAKTRRYMFAQTEIDADRFAYHGTGKELLLGYAKAVLVFFLPVMLLNAIPELTGAGPAVQSLVGFVVSGLALVFVPIAIVGARRYRLGRSSWRGIRFAFRGDTREFVKLFVHGSLLTAVTAGLYYPVFVVRQYQFLASHSWFGNARVDFDGSPTALFRPFLGLVAAWASVFVGFPIVVASAGPAAGGVWALFALPLAAVTWVWWRATRRRFLWNHTTLDSARFHSTVTARRLLGLYAVNLALLIVTVGLATPWVSVRSARFACRHLALAGPLDLDAVLQAPATAAGTTGEGLSGFFDADLNLG